MRYIVQLKTGMYVYWSTVTDSPVCNIKTYEEMRESISNSYKNFDLDIWLNKLERARVYGVSFSADNFKATSETKSRPACFRTELVLELVDQNRAGDKEESIPLSKMIKKFSSPEDKKKNAPAPDFSDTLKTVIGSILHHGKDERAVKYNDEFTKMIEAFKVEDPEGFYFKFVYEKELLRDDAVELAIKDKFPEISNVNLYKLKSVFRYYQEIEGFVNKIVTKEETFSCSSDKSGHLVRLYIREKSGTLKKKLPPCYDRLNYWHPNKGDHDQWMLIIDSYIDCIDSKPDRLVSEYPPFIEHLKNSVSAEESEKLKQFNCEKYGQRLAERAKNPQEIEKINHPRISPIKLLDYLGKFQSYQKEPERLAYLKAWIGKLPREIIDGGFVNFFSVYEHMYLSTELDAMYEDWYK